MRIKMLRQRTKKDRRDQTTNPARIHPIMPPASPPSGLRVYKSDYWMDDIESARITLFKKSARKVPETVF